MSQESMAPLGEDEAENELARRQKLKDEETERYEKSLEPFTATEAQVEEIKAAVMAGAKGPLLAIPQEFKTALRTACNLFCTHPTVARREALALAFDEMVDRVELEDGEDERFKRNVEDRVRAIAVHAQIQDNAKKRDDAAAAAAGLKVADRAEVVKKHEADQAEDMKTQAAANEKAVAEGDSKE